MSVSSIYLQSAPFAWGVEKYVIYSSLSSSLKVISFGLAKLLEHCGVRSHFIIYLSLIDAIIFNVSFGLVETSRGIMVATLLMMGQETLIPVIRNLLSESVEKHHQGAVFGFLGYIEGMVSYYKVVRF